MTTNIIINIDGDDVDCPTCSKRIAGEPLTENDTMTCETCELYGQLQDVERHIKLLQDKLIHGDSRDAEEYHNNIDLVIKERRNILDYALKNDIQLFN